MAGFIPKTASPETRADSLLTEKRITETIEAQLRLPAAERALLPKRTKYMLTEFEIEGRKR